jgi:hypothetical protein
MEITGAAFYILRSVNSDVLAGGSSFKVMGGAYVPYSKDTRRVYSPAAADLFSKGRVQTFAFRRY